MADKELIKIDLSKIIRARVSKGRGRFIPSFILNYLERLICQDELNKILEYAYPANGSQFSKRALEYLNIKLEVDGLDKLPVNENFEFASNHPLGGLDGISLVAVLGEFCGDEELKVVVNDMLMNVTPLEDVFLPINKYGSQARTSAKKINGAFQEGKQIVMFPAGLVSRLHSDGKIHDLKWQKAFVVKALEHQRRIVPITFKGLNSMKFYKTAYWRKKLGIKINFEQALLPSEVIKARNKNFKIIFGSPIDVCKMHSDGMTVMQIAEEIHKIVEES